jgi:hypothetical protein
MRKITLAVLLVFCIGAFVSSYAEARHLLTQKQIEEIMEATKKFAEDFLAGKGSKMHHPLTPGQMKMLKEKAKKFAEDFLAGKGSKMHHPLTPGQMEMLKKKVNEAVKKWSGKNCPRHQVPAEKPIAKETIPTEEQKVLKQSYINNDGNLLASVRQNLVSVDEDSSHPIKVALYRKGYKQWAQITFNKRQVSLVENPVVNVKVRSGVAKEAQKLLGKKFAPHIEFVGSIDEKYTAWRFLDAVSTYGKDVYTHENGRFLEKLVDKVSLSLELIKNTDPNQKLTSAIGKLVIRGTNKVAKKVLVSAELYFPFRTNVTGKENEKDSS